MQECKIDILNGRRQIIQTILVQAYFEENYGVFFKDRNNRDNGFIPFPGKRFAFVKREALKMARRNLKAKGFLVDGKTKKIKREIFAPVTPKLLSRILGQINQGYFDDAITAVKMAVDNKQFKIIRKIHDAAQKRSHYTKLFRAPDTSSHKKLLDFIRTIEQLSETRTYGNPYSFSQEVIMSNTYDIVVICVLRENYGAHGWDGTGECPQLWKNKGSNFIRIASNLDEAELNLILDKHRCFNSIIQTEYFELDNNSFKRSVVDVVPVRTVDGIPVDDDSLAMEYKFGISDTIVRYGEPIKKVELSREHVWECISPGMYDFTYKCARCDATYVESIDNPATYNPPKTDCVA